MGYELARKTHLVACSHRLFSDCSQRLFGDCCERLLSEQQEKLDIEEKYTSLQDEVSGKTKKLKKVWQMLGQAKSEVSHSQPHSCTYICR